MTKTIVLGLDGGNWELIEQWIADGRLPNIQELKSDGAYGVSESHLPPVTCPNWKCYASGKNPGKLGVYWWENIDADNGKVRIHEATDFTSPELWDYLNQRGIRTGVMNLPMSYPPRTINGFMIAGGPRSGSDEYTHPEELQSYIEREHSYRVHPETLLRSSDESDPGVAAIHRLIETRLQTARDLLENKDVEFLHVTVFYLNVLQHYFWDGVPTRKAWEIIDAQIGELRDEDYNIIIMSDHGCTETDTVFYINKWLETNGYLTTEHSFSEYLHSIGLTQERLIRIANRTGLADTIRSLIPRRLFDFFPSDDGIVQSGKMNAINLADTTAIGSGQGLVYVKSEADSQIVSELKDELAEATNADGEPIAQSVFAPEELYSGKYLNTAPDVIFDQRPGVHTSDAIGQSNITASPQKWRAENVPDGMVLFHGDDIKSQDIGRVKITDIMPTILHWFDTPIPADIDGTVQTEIFADGSAPANTNVRSQRPLSELSADGTSEDLDDEVRDRLEDIGYLE